ncbi:MAG TPA: tetratricopeptide repeat protein [Ktedonobacteraceae bacterium]|nr:tetratricopeptide repeat protein [Ktedonobacteraceae bacterium]
MASNGKDITTQEQEQYCENCGAANPVTARFCQFCATLLPFKYTTGSLPDQTLLAGRYQLLSRIGQGGMGAVYKAADTRFNNRPVAIKEMSSTGLSPASLQEAETAFEREAHLLADLLHPNLPRIYEHFAENDRSYLVMDFIEGQTLEEYLEQIGGGPLPVDQVIKWGEQLCDVLNYLHTHQPPIVFRDLKPANVMISESGHIFLIDFGIARIFKPGKQHDTVALGSPGYAAPEQYGKSQSTPRSDIYSLGALLHHLLTGNDPSDQPFFFQSASRLNPAVDPTLDALLQKMLEMDSDRRPASALEVLNALEGIGASQSRSTSAPLTSPQDPLLEEAYRLYTQRRLDEALAIYNKALQANTTSPLGWQGYALTQRLRGLDHEALSSFERALQLEPGLVTSWNGKGTVLSKLRRHREALEAFEHALQLDPNNAAAWNGKGIALSAQGRSKQALTAFETALRFDPLLVQAWCNKGVLLYEMNRYADAERAYQEAINLDSKLPIAYFGCGQALYAQRKLKQALRMFERAIQEDLKYIEAWNRRGNILDELGDTVRALQSYDQALQIDAHFAPAWSGKAGILRQQGHYFDALKAYNFALDIDPSFTLAWNGKGNTLYNMRNYYEALAAYEHALKLNPRLRTAWHNKSLVLYQLSRYEESLKAADEAIRLQPNAPDNWQRKADALKKLRRREEARFAEGQAARLRGNA